MNSILRKAMWPAALIVGMFVLIGAFGHATAPTASAAPDEACDIVGPIPTTGGLGLDNDNDLLIEDNEYLFIYVIEDPTATPFVADIHVDDESGRAGITAYSTVSATGGEWNVEPGVDIAINAEAGLFADYTSPPDFLDEVEDDWDVTIPTATNTATWFNILGCGADVDTVADDGVGEDAIGFFTVECDRSGTFELTIVEGGDVLAPITEQYECVNAPSALTLTAFPLTVESVPALGNISHSLLIGELTDGDGHYVAEGYDVDFETTACELSALDEDDVADTLDMFGDWDSAMTPGNAADIELEFSGHGGLDDEATATSFNASLAGYGFGSFAAAVLHCEGADPGVATVSATIPDSQEDATELINMGPSDDVDSNEIDITIVGPPAFISMTAAPEELTCGEKATILVTVTDAINQNVSDHTRVELITNYGGVIGGTGSSLGFPGVNPVNPLSSSAAETFGGVATAYLLTSSNHVGPYEVVAAAGGSNLGSYSVFAGFEIIGEESVELFYQGGNQFSTPVVTSQVTVVCTEGEEPEVTAPDTGTGTISPPNTGDAGLAAGTTSTTLFVIAGAVAFVLAGFAKLGFARRS